MKILFFITGLGNGGAEKQLFHLISGLSKKKNVKIKIISIFGGDYEKKLKKLKITTKILFSKNEKFNFLKSILFFKNEVKKFKPEIVHSFLYHSNIISKLSLFIMRKNFKLICSYRSLTLKYPLIAIIEFINMWRVDFLISNSKRGLKDLRIYNMFNISKQVIYNGFLLKNIDKKQVLKLKKKYKNKKIILSIGRFSYEKDYNTNINTVIELSKKRDDFIFLYVGEGKLKNEIKLKAKNNNVLKRINFLNKRDDILELFSISDVFFHPTLYESQSNTLMEAMAIKVPIVTTNISENHEIIKNGFFCEIADFNNMANSINDILNNGYSKNKLIENYNLIISKHSFSIMIEKYYKLYRGLLK